MSVQLRNTPITLPLGGKVRRLRFNLNSALLIREAGKDGADVWEQIGEKPAVDGQEPEKLYRVSYENLRVYLWAMLQSDAPDLTIEAVGEYLEERSAVMAATRAVSLEIARWYGVPLGELQTPHAS